MTEASPYLRVVCAVIRENARYLIAQRALGMRQALLWEFPGGKVEAGESDEQALNRELREELGIRVKVKGRLRPIKKNSQGLNILLCPFLCVRADSQLERREHRALAWVTLKEMVSFDLCEADLFSLSMLQEKGLEESAWWV